MIYKITEVIALVIPEDFHIPLSMDQESPLHIFPFYLMAKMSRYDSDYLPTFIKCAIHSKFG